MSSAETQKLVLPLPGQLTAETCSAGSAAPDISALTECLASGLDNAAAVQGWLDEHSCE